MVDQPLKNRSKNIYISPKNQNIAMCFNRMLNRTGHFWEKRYHSSGFPTTDKERALNTLRYIHANPKAAGCCFGFFGRVEVCITASPLPCETVHAPFNAHGYSACCPFVISDFLTAGLMRLGISFTHSQLNESQNRESLSRNFEWSFFLISFRSSAVFSS